MTSKKQQTCRNALKARKFLKKLVVSKPLNSISFNGIQLILNYKLYFDEKAIIYFIPKSSIIYHNKPFDCKNDNKYRRNQLNQEKPKNQ